MLDRGSKQALWDDFVSAHQVDQCSVPLFAIENGLVTSFAYGRDQRLMLKRSAEMNTLMRRLGEKLMGEFRQNIILHDGIASQLSDSPNDLGLRSPSGNCSAPCAWPTEPGNQPDSDACHARRPRGPPPGVSYRCGISVWGQ